MKRMSEGERYALRDIAHSKVVKRAGELWPFRRVPDAVFDGRIVECWWAPDLAHAYRLADGWWAMNSGDPAHKLDPCVGPFPSLEQAIAAHKVARDKWLEQCAYEETQKRTRAVRAEVRVRDLERKVAEMVSEEPCLCDMMARGTCFACRVRREITRRELLGDHFYGGIIDKALVAAEESLRSVGDDNAMVRPECLGSGKQPWWASRRLLVVSDKFSCFIGEARHDWFKDIIQEWLLKHGFDESIASEVTFELKTHAELREELQLP